MDPVCRRDGWKSRSPRRCSCRNWKLRLRRWKSCAASASALAAAVIAALFVRPGPHLTAAAPFDWRQAARGFADPALRKANFGYLGHMWELYAIWAWVGAFMLAVLGTRPLASPLSQPSSSQASRS